MGSRGIIFTGDEAECLLDMKHEAESRILGRRLVKAVIRREMEREVLEGKNCGK